MGIEKLEVAGVIDNAAHQIAGLLVVEKRKIEALKLIVQAAPKVPYKVPGGAVREVVCEKPEQYPQKIETEKPEGEIPDGGKGRVIDALADDAGHLREKLRRRKVDDGESEGGENGDHVQALVAGRFFCEFPECLHGSLLADVRITCSVIAIILQGKLP